MCLSSSNQSSQATPLAKKSKLIAAKLYARCLIQGRASVWLLVRQGQPTGVDGNCKRILQKAVCLGVYNFTKAFSCSYMLIFECEAFCSPFIRPGFVGSPLVV